MMRNKENMSVENIGRISILKYCFITILVLFIAPLILGLFYQLFLGAGKDALGYYSLYYWFIVDNYVQILISFIFLAAYIWFAGAMVGRLIILKIKPMFLIGGLCFLGVWLVLFAGTIFTDVILNFTEWLESGFGNILGWFRYSLPSFIINGVLHGLLMGYPLGSEVTNKGKKMILR